MEYEQAVAKAANALNARIEKSMLDKAVEFATQNASPSDPEKWVRMTRTLVYEGTEQMIRAQQINRGVKESMYVRGGRMLETSLTIEDMTEDEVKIAKVDMRLSSVYPGTTDTQPGPAIGGAYSNDYAGYGSGKSKI